jgi:hypothetical protein
LTIFLALDTGDNGWVISVGYNDGFAPAYGVWDGLVFVSAVIFTFLMMLNKGSSIASIDAI